MNRKWSVLNASSGTLALGLALLTAAPAGAQLRNPPPHDSKSPTGVSYRDGSFSTSEEDLSIGGGSSAGGLSLNRSYNSGVDASPGNYLAAGWTHSLNIYLTISAIPQNPDLAAVGGYPQNYPDQCLYSVTGGMSSVPFAYVNGTGNRVLTPPVYNPNYHSGCGPYTGTYVPTYRSGQKLEYVQDAGVWHYRYTGPDGTVVNFNTGYRATDRTSPDGTKLVFTYSGNTLQSVFSNRGWAILFESRTKICAVNTAQTYVTSGSACPSDAQAVTYSYATGTYSTSTSLLTSATRNSQTRQYLYASNDHLNCIKDPGQSSCRIQNTYFPCPEDPYRGSSIQTDMRLRDPVTSQTDGSGRTITYSYQFNACPVWSTSTDTDTRPYSEGVTTVTESGIAGSMTVRTTPDANPVSVVDYLGRTATYSRYNAADYVPGDYIDLQESGEPSGVTYPESNGLSTDDRDSRGNITISKQLAKSGSGLTTLTTTAAYPTSCTSIITCNKPTAVTDANGKTTDYTYDGTHGGVLTETLPADADGVRAVKRYSYVQRAAWLRTSGGSYAASANPIWLVSTMRTCAKTATSGSTCAGGSADEIVTTYEYGPDSGPNNLLVRGMAVTSNGVSLRTCYSYDRDGRKISETKPAANLGVCP